MEEVQKSETRFVGIDLGKKTYQMAVVGPDGKVTMSNGRTFYAGRQGLYKRLRPGDKVALEACSMAFTIAKEIEETVGCKVYVLNPYKLAIIFASMKKTDKEDSLKLAHILEDCREERLPVIPIPGDKEVRRRKILASYRRVRKDRSRELNLLHGLFVSQGITTIVKKDLSDAERRKDAIKVLTGIDLEEAGYLLKRLELSEERIGVLEKQMADESAGDKEIECLQSIPGVGPKVSFGFVAHVAVERFENASQLSNYLGLVPRVYMSGQTVKYGGITKRGNSYLRALLVQAAWALIRSKKGGKLKELYEYMTKERSKSKKVAIVAVARQLAEMMYAMLRDKVWYAKRSLKKPEESKNAEIAKLAESAISA